KTMVTRDEVQLTSLLLPSMLTVPEPREKLRTQVMVMPVEVQPLNVNAPTVAVATPPAAGLLVTDRLIDDPVQLTGPIVATVPDLSGAVRTSPMPTFGRPTELTVRTSVPAAEAGTA